MEIQRFEELERPERSLQQETEQAEVNLRRMSRSEIKELSDVKQNGIEKSTDQQIQEGREALESIPEFRPENWQRLGDSQRLQACQNLEDRMAEILERPPVSISAESMEPGAFGYFSPMDRKIHISLEHLRSNDIAEIQDTIVHEGRHAYQQYAVEHPGFHSDEAQVVAWKVNLQPGHYLPADIVGQRAYMRQPVEADAWSYAGQIVRR